MVSLLLRYGANLDHISALSWTPLFYCWPKLEATHISMANFLTTLANADDFDVNIIDKWGWTVIDRAAAYGTADDIETLINLGASVNTCALPLRWSAIFHATYYGNFETFLTLVPHYSPIIIQETDARGWTLLHIAASAGHVQIVRHLLSLGTDPYSLSKPYMSHMPKELFGRRCTPEEVAAAQSARRREQFLEAVKEVS